MPRDSYRTRLKPEGYGQKQPYGQFTWCDKAYTSSIDYYREVVMSLPLDPEDPKGRAVMGAADHARVLERLCPYSSYLIHTKEGADHVYVDDWSIEDECLYHRHPELTAQDINGWDYGFLEWEVLDSKCTMCDKQIPEEIWMMHKFYQL